MPRSIRFRLTAWYALILAAALGIFSCLIWLSLRQRLLSEIDQDLASRAGQFERYVIHEASEIPPVTLKDELEEFCQALPESTALALHGSNGFEFSYPAKSTRPGKRIRPWRIRTLERQFTTGGQTFNLRMTSSLDNVFHTLELLRFLLLSLVPIVIAIACLGGAWLSRRALKPVDDVTAAARSISIDNLSLRLQDPQTGDELQRLTEVWNTMLERLESAVKTLSQFAADASHELRTPLAVIRTSAELSLRRARSPESYRDSLQEIVEESDRMTQLVEDLLLLARNDSQSADMPRETVELTGILAEAVERLRPLADARGIRIIQRPHSDPLYLSGNRSALRRLTLVLLDNAIKYSHANSEISASIEGPALIIEDKGIGIHPADQPHIFKRFYQADQARTDGGFGLGLSLAKSIADAHRASIQLKSEPGQGSRFSVIFTPVGRHTAVSSFIGEIQNAAPTHFEA